MPRLAVLLALSLAACAAAPPPTCAAAHPGMRMYFMGFLYRGPAWTPEGSETIGEGHMQHIRDMAAADQLIMAGPFEQPPEAREALAGIFVLTVPTLAEARALMEDDPAVKAQRFRYELVEWYGPKSLLCTK